MLVAVAVLLVAITLVMLAVLDNRAGISLQRRGTAAACVMGIVAASLCICLCLSGIDRETDGWRARRRCLKQPLGSDSSGGEAAYFHSLLRAGNVAGGRK